MTAKIIPFNAMDKKKPKSAFCGHVQNAYLMVVQSDKACICVDCLRKAKRLSDAEDDDA